MTTLLELVDITKRFPGVVANDQINFDLREGEIHALLGENGAGKTTLMNILYGLVRPDKGEIRVRNRVCHITCPRDALSYGIGMVHQHFMLVPTMTIAENIILGQELTRGPFLLRREANEVIGRLSAEYGLNVAPQRRIWQLSVGEQQRVEILKVLYRGAEILILDEPTAVLTPPETDALFTILRSMAKSGRSVIFISHKLEEVMAISDRVTVFRRGRVAGTVNTKDTTEVELARMMVGREVAIHVARSEPAACGGEVVAALKDVCLMGDYGKLALTDINLELCAGEIVGVAGVDGNGQAELAAVLAGLQCPSKGSLSFDGEDITKTNPWERIARGIWYVPADRKARGAVMDLSIAQNLILKNHRHAPLSNRGVLSHKAIEAFAHELVKKYDVRCSSIDAPAGTLSGGNLQKLILARETVSNPRLLVAEHPSRGLDIGATEYVRQSILMQSREGTSVLLISADLDEIVALSDRIVVMFEGKIVYECRGDEVDIEEVGLAMAGYKLGEKSLN